MELYPCSSVPLVDKLVPGESVRIGQRIGSSEVLHCSEDGLRTIYCSEILAGYDDQREWSFCPEDPNDGTGTPYKTQAQYKKDLLPETYPWALYTQT